MISASEIRDFPDYLINTIGEVFSNRKFNKTHKLSICLDSCGYPMVSIFKGDKRIVCRVHRLMARTFLASFKEELFVNHINGIKTDNVIENLEMCTRSENTLHSFKLGLQTPLRGSSNGWAKLSDDEVIEIRALLGTTSGIKIAKIYKVSKRTIYRIRDGITWSHLQ